jgi:hypothetical protein
MKKQTIESLYSMDDAALRIWLRLVWAKHFPDRVTTWVDQFDLAVWTEVQLPKNDPNFEKIGALAYEIKDVQGRINTICHTCRIAPPYQALQP